MRTSAEKNYLVSAINWNKKVTKWNNWTVDVYQLVLIIQLSLSRDGVLFVIYVNIYIYFWLKYSHNK